MHWSVAAGFTLDPRVDRWLVPFVRSDRHRFTLVPAPRAVTWHQRARPLMGVAEWARTLAHGVAAWRASEGGVISVFPQLAVSVGLCQRLGRLRRPVVAWCFNTGALHAGARAVAARTALAHVDRFVVHSRGEVAHYAEWLRLPPSRFHFVHLPRPPIPIERPEEASAPFLLAMGSARRDYATLFEAVRRSGHRTLVVAARHALDGLSPPPNVQCVGGLTPRECRHLAQRARLSVVPVWNDATASGQVTIVEAMRMGRPVVATRSIGSRDYIDDGVSGLLVEPRDPDGLRSAIDRLWDDGPLRERLGREAASFTERHCSDEAAGAALGRLLDEVEDERGMEPEGRPDS